MPRATTAAWTTVPLGAAPGMVMMAEPLQRCLEAIRADRVDRAPVVLFSPTGAAGPCRRAGWASGAGAVLLCGRYEGLDQRFIDHPRRRQQISLGDFVLSGGEIAAWLCWMPWPACSPVCSMTRAATSSTASTRRSTACWIARTTPGPKSGTGKPVPAALLSGHHAQIERWRRDRRLDHPASRPDLIEPQPVPRGAWQSKTRAAPGRSHWRKPP
jgi:tRNA (guanine37-N1)-methyltransferase